MQLPCSTKALRWRRCSPPRRTATPMSFSGFGRGFPGWPAAWGSCSGVSASGGGSEGLEQEGREGVFLTRREADGPPPEVSLLLLCSSEFGAPVSVPVQEVLDVICRTLSVSARNIVSGVRPPPRIPRPLPCAASAWMCSCVVETRVADASPGRASWGSVESLPRGLASPRRVLPPCSALEDGSLVWWEAVWTRASVCTALSRLVLPAPHLGPFVPQSLLGDGPLRLLLLPSLHLEALDLLSALILA